MGIGPKATLTFNLALLVVFLGMLGVSLTPDFGGGHLVALVAVFTAGSLTWVMVKDSFFGRGRKGSAQRAAFDEADATAPRARESWLAVLYVLLLLVLVYFLGTLVGSVLFVGAFLLLHRSGNPWIAILLALTVGASVPYLLARALDVHLWEGVIPEIVPGWIGGGTPPLL